MSEDSKSVSMKTLLIYLVCLGGAVLFILFVTSNRDNSAREEGDKNVKNELNAEFGKKAQELSGTIKELSEKIISDSAKIFDLQFVTVKVDSFARAHDEELKSLKNQIINLKKNGGNSYKTIIAKLELRIASLESEKDKKVIVPPTPPKKIAPKTPYNFDGENETEENETESNETESNETEY